MVGESQEGNREAEEEVKEEGKEGDRQVTLREWTFVNEVTAKCRTWITTWMQTNPLKYELIPFDVHKDEDKDFTCLVKVNSCKEELSNLMFRGVNTSNGVKITALQTFGDDE